MRMRALILVAAALAGCATEPSTSLPPSGPLPEAGHSTIGYATVQEAFDALKTKPGVEIREERGWRVANDKNERTLWSFTPEGHPAHPAVAKRTVIEKDGAIWLDLNVHCEAAKDPCDQFVRDFQALNDRIKTNMSKPSK